MKNNKILLIGGRGYIGKALYSKLKNGHIVHITGRRRTKKDNSDFKQIDFNNEKSIISALKESYDLIIILAANIKIQVSDHIDLEDDLFNDNLYGFNKLLSNLCKLQKNTNIIYISSMTVYDKNSKVPVSENANLNPLHPYGLSKILAEQIFSYYISHNSNNGIVIRIPGVYGGDRTKGYIYNLIKKLLNSEDIFIDTTNLGYWETINIDDLTEMIIEFITNYDCKKKYDIFNISYGEETDFIETAYKLRDLMGLKNKITIQKKNYKKFYMDNKKSRKYVTAEKFSYLKSLERYSNTFK